MYKAMSFWLGLAGVLMIAFMGFIDAPTSFKAILFLFGGILWFAGLMILFIRIDKMGLNSLISPAGPDEVIWFYVRKDGSMMITPALRKQRLSEGMLYNPETNGWAADMKAYHLGDKSVRFVIEEVGKCVDLDICAYSKFLKGHGLASLTDVFAWNKNKHARNNDFEERVGVYQTDNINIEQLLEQLKQERDFLTQQQALIDTSDENKAVEERSKLLTAIKTMNHNIDVLQEQVESTLEIQKKNMEAPKHD